MALFSFEEIRKANEENGYTYFAPFNTGKRAKNPGFRSRILTPILSVPCGAVFVESTRAGHQHRREYTVCYQDERGGDVKKLSGFQEYRSSTGAKGRALREQTRLRDEQAQTYAEPVRYFLESNGFMDDVDMPVFVFEIDRNVVGLNVRHEGSVYGTGRAGVLREVLENEAPESWKVEFVSKSEHERTGQDEFIVTLPRTTG